MGDAGVVQGSVMNGMLSLRKILKELKKSSFCACDKHCETGMFTTMFNLVVHTSEDLEMSGSVCFQNSSAYVHFTLFLRK